MRAAALILAFAAAMVAASPAMSINNLNGRADCFCDESSCDGPPAAPMVLALRIPGISWEGGLHIDNDGKG
ncbi:hypothetical protein PG997_002051 [Apiospora hydei]|uniref:Uncharacterized protein n=1 Tax=Apiospora hydei TaxID=1337664 RepID=A0ABR1X8A9_9PEZI